MVIKFKYGFEYKNFLYGWNKKELYRLPIIVHKRSYPLKKLNSIKINSHKGYRIVKDKKTIKQLQ
ncbi:hypothetical protein M1M25_gp063 [Tenacibaculum phage Gundel_1]|uniref:Uncharacterized protein n=1 Tax=Tenacibaculum phage Gundel_1 TaxID=2745672 RepID=A0A8E4ZDI1_9CAUD|nr:hypothetical protein M1M25_gp063 [Tenacibaculum phage Gundel_1]QQV91498.1 hypothetical protein Gundel1_63 [Tenacibaculum phage Gundel_1]